MTTLGDGCFCSAHQDCYQAALEGCALCAGAEIRRLTKFWDTLLTAEKRKAEALELDVVALLANVATLLANKIKVWCEACKGCGVIEDGVGEDRALLDCEDCGGKGYTQAHPELPRKP